MTTGSANVEDFGVDSSWLAGPIEGKLSAVLEAGFGQIVLSASCLVNHPSGVDAAVAAVLSSGLRVTAFQALTDFEGLSGPLLAYKIDVAKSMLEMCHALGCHCLVVTASTLAAASTDEATLVRHLRQLAMLAIPKNIRIAYRADPQARAARHFGQAWDLLCLADMPNLGLCLDLADALAAPELQDDLDMLDPGKLFLVQLADNLGTPDGARLFPGEGPNSAQLAETVTHLHDLGYWGNYALSARNPDYLLMPAPTVVQRAHAAALWLGQDVLQRSVPLPNQIRLKRRQTD